MPLLPPFIPRRPSRRRNRETVAAAEPPPPPPPGPPHVVSAYFSGNTVVLVFDQTVVLTGSPPDDAITVNGETPTSAIMADATSLSLAMPSTVNAGDPWAIVRQPEWMETAVEVPEGGVL